MKRFLSVLLSAVLISICICGCKKQEPKLYLPATLRCYVDESLSYTIKYTYNEDGKLVKETGRYENDSLRNYTDVYSYNNDGELTGMLKTEFGEDTAYTAEKITKYKYILTDADNRTITIIFDDKGHIVSFKTSDGYLLEYAYTYSETGQPTSMKKQIVNPSGSNKLFEYSINFTDDETYECHDNADASYYYEVECLVKEGAKK